jgi:hypothetical protein
MSISAPLTALESDRARAYAAMVGLGGSGWQAALSSIPPDNFAPSILFGKRQSRRFQHGRRLCCFLLKKQPEGDRAWAMLSLVGLVAGLKPLTASSTTIADP